jgi:hypothetical protein
MKETTAEIVTLIPIILTTYLAYCGWVFRDRMEPENPGAAANSVEHAGAAPAAGPDGRRLTVDRRYAIGIGVAFAAVGAFGIWVLTPRFGIEMPSLIDDWLFATAPPPTAGDMLGFFFEPTIGRFRPTYEMWQLVQWHAFGAPQDVLVPNLFGVVRVLVFCATVVVVPGAVAATSHTRPAPLLLAGLCLSGGLLIFSSPSTDGSFLALGAQEPLLVPTTVSGLALLAWSTGRLLAKAERTWLTAVGFLSGFALWAFGVYHKEASIALLAGAPFLYLHLDRRWREGRLIDGPLWRQRPFQLVAAAILVPVVHLAVGMTSVRGGVGHYTGEQPSSLGGWLERVADSAGVIWDISAAAGLSEWRFILPCLLVMAAVVAVHRNRIPWLAIGCLGTGLAALIFQGLLLEPAPRFLIPGISLFVIAAVLLLAELPSWLGWAAIVAALAMTVTDVGEVRNSAKQYADWQEGEGEALEFVSRLHPETCPGYMKNIGGEIGEAMPRLIGLLRTTPGSCPKGFAGIVVGFEVPPLVPYPIDDSAYRACADRGGPKLLYRSNGSEGIPQGAIEVHGCHRFAQNLNGQPTELLLARNRLKPGVGIYELRSEECAPRYGARACSPLHRPG